MKKLLVLTILTLGFVGTTLKLVRKICDEVKMKLHNAHGKLYTKRIL